MSAPETPAEPALAQVVNLIDALVALAKDHGSDVLDRLAEVITGQEDAKGAHTALTADVAALRADLQDVKDLLARNHIREDVQDSVHEAVSAVENKLREAREWLLGGGHSVGSTPTPVPAPVFEPDPASVFVSDPAPAVVASPANTTYPYAATPFPGGVISYNS